MGTRCNIVLEYWGSDQVKYMYRHYDGYPSSVRPELKKYAEAIRWYADNYKEFVKQGDEQLAPHTNEGIKKLFAEPSRLLEFYADLLVKHEAWDGVRKVLNPRHKQTHYEPMQLTGKYEITDGIHGDIDYLYVITIDETYHRVCSISEYDRDSFNQYMPELGLRWA